MEIQMWAVIVNNEEDNDLFVAAFSDKQTAENEYDQILKFCHREDMSLKQVTMTI